MASFSKSEAISYGFKTAKKNLVFFIILFVIAFAANIVPSIISSEAGGNHAPLLAFIASLAGWALQLTVSLGLIGIALKIYDGKKAEYKNLFDYFRLILPYFLGSIIYGLIVFVGLILLVVPGIVWGIKFRYYSYFMVDRNMGPIDAMKASSKITQGNKWNLFLLGILLALVNIVGFLCLIVGLFITVPTTMMAEAYVFRKLSAK